MQLWAITIVMVMFIMGCQGYTTEYDNLDYDAILHNDRLLRKYVDCVIGKGKCNKEGRTLKEFLSDAGTNDCATCNPKQKERARYVSKYLIDNKFDWYKEMEPTIDPTGHYLKAYIDNGREWPEFVPQP